MDGSVTLYFATFNLFNASYLTDSYIVFTLKIESVSKHSIFGIKMIVKSGLKSEDFCKKTKFQEQK